MCPNGVIIDGFVKSVSMALTQARECNPSQFIEHDPQIPSLHDLLKDKDGSCLSLIYKRASKYIGAHLFKSI